MKRKSIFITITASVLSCTALAQYAAGESKVLNEIVIESADNGRENSVELTEDDLQHVNPTDLQDVFKSEPTISVSSSLPASQKLYVNGIEETNLSVTIDGARQNNKIFHHNATTLIDPTLLKQVSVDPGVAPADAGPGALAGSVQYETKDVKDLLDEGDNFGGFIVGEYNSNGDTLTPSLSLFGKQNGFEFLAFGKYSDGNLQEDGNGDDIPGSTSDLTSFLSKVAYQSETGDRIELSYENVEDDAQRPYRADIGLIMGGRPVPLTRRYGLERENIVLTYTDEIAEGWWDPTIKIAYSSTKLELEEPGDFNEGETDSLNGKIENKLSVSNGSITTGLDYYREEASFFYGFDSSSGSEEAQNIGIYTQARLNFVDALFISAGFRGDRHTFEGLSDFDESNSGLSYNTSLEYQINDIVTAGVGYAHVFAGVPLAENFIMNTAWTYDSSSIKPVESDNYYGALKADFDHFYLDSKLFRTDIDDARIAQFSDANIVSNVKSEGFEIGAGVSWNGGYLRAAYADIDTEINGSGADSFSGRYLTAPIGRIITLDATHTLNDTNMTLGATAEIGLDESAAFPGDEEGDIEGYEVVDVFVEYTPEALDSLTLRLAVNNLFDEAYAARGTYGQEFDSVSPLLEPGRAFKLTVTSNF